MATYTGRFQAGTRVRLRTPYKIAGGLTTSPDWWTQLPVGTEGVIVGTAYPQEWPDRSGDYHVRWYHPTAEHDQYAHDSCLEFAVPIDLSTIDSVEAFLEAP